MNEEHTGEWLVAWLTGRLSCEFGLRDKEEVFPRQFLRENTENEVSVFIESLVCN